MSFRELAEEFKALPNDTEKWKWILERKDSIEVVLDNDWTGAYFDGDDDEDPISLTFEDWIGNDQGVFSLLAAIGVKASSV